jgi:hypothetical protein
MSEDSPSQGIIFNPVRQITKEKLPVALSTYEYNPTLSIVLASWTAEKGAEILTNYEDGIGAVPQCTSLQVRCGDISNGKCETGSIQMGGITG